MHVQDLKLSDFSKIQSDYEDNHWLKNDTVSKGEGEEEEEEGEPIKPSEQIIKSSYPHPEISHQTGSPLTGLPC